MELSSTKMQSFFSRHVRGLCRFFCAKYSKVRDTLIDLNLRTPLICACHPANSENARGTSFASTFLILCVFGIIKFSQIAYSVVLAIPVYMVYLRLRKLPMHQKPDYSMFKVVSPINAQIPVQFRRMHVSCALPNFGGVA